MANENNDQEYEQVGEFVRIFQRGKTWYANFQHGGRQHRKSLKTTSKKEARARAIRLEADLSSGRFQERTRVATVTETVAAYKENLQTEPHAITTLRKYFSVFARVVALAEQRNAKTMDQLNLAFVDQYRSMRVKAKKAPKTVYAETVVIRQLVNFALTRDMIFQDPLKNLRLFKPRPTPQPCWTLEEVQSILAACPPEVKPALTLLAETGMRFGELAWLTWDDVDWAKNVLHVQPKEGWKPKTGDQRSIPISAAARAILEVLPRRWRWVVTSPATIRHQKSDRQWSEKQLLSGLKKVLRQLELPGKLHTFRHYFISNALMKGTPVPTVREWVGHVDPEILKLYTHIHDSASQSAMQRLGKANHQELQPGVKNYEQEAQDRSAQFQHRPHKED